MGTSLVSLCRRTEGRCDNGGLHHEHFANGGKTKSIATIGLIMGHVAMISNRDMDDVSIAGRQLLQKKKDRCGKHVKKTSGAGTCHGLRL